MRRWGFRSSEPTTQLNNLWGLFKIPRCWRFLDPTSRLETFICDPCNSSSPAPQVCKSIRSVETLRRYGLNLSVNSSNNVPLPLLLLLLLCRRYAAASAASAAARCCLLILLFAASCSCSCWIRLVPLLPLLLLCFSCWCCLL